MAEYRFFLSRILQEKDRIYDYLNMARNEDLQDQSYSHKFVFDHVVLVLLSKDLFSLLFLTGHIQVIVLFQIQNEFEKVIFTILVQLFSCLLFIFFPKKERQFSSLPEFKMATTTLNKTFHMLQQVLTQHRIFSSLIK